MDVVGLHSLRLHHESMLSSQQLIILVGWQFSCVHFERNLQRCQSVLAKESLVWRRDERGPTSTSRIAFLSC